jgi:hypothetical protein
MPDFIIEHDGVDSITAPHIGKQIVLNNCWKNTQWFYTGWSVFV